MKTIEQMLDELYAREGGYVNNPNDKGGPTNKGITEQVARAYGYSGDMRHIPEGIVKEIYKQQYWLNPGFNVVQKMMPRLAEELFDTGVNMGPKTASKFFQRLLNVLNRRATDYPDIVVDGDLGTMSFHSLTLLANKRGKDIAENLLLKGMNALQGARYIGIAEADPTQETFVWGWLTQRVDFVG